MEWLFGPFVLLDLFKSDRAARNPRLVISASFVDIETKMHSLVAAALIFILVPVLIWHFIVYPLFWSPLASIPAAHPLCHITSLWIHWKRLRGQEYECVSEAFLSKGPYVRLGPREVAVNDIEAVRNGWGVGSSSFDKHHSYTYFGTHGITNTFTTLGSNEHRGRRHRLRIAHSRQFLMKSPDVQSILASLVQQKLYPLLADLASSKEGTASIMPLAQSFALDYVSAFAFGLSLGHSFLKDRLAYDQWFALNNDCYPGGFLGYLLKEHPRLVEFARRLGVPILSKTYVNARRELETWALRRVDAAEDLLQSRMQGSEPTPGDLPVLYDAVRTAMAQQSGVENADFVPSATQRLELASECLDHITSSGETFGTTFTYMLWELSRHPDIQAALHVELSSLKQPLSESNLPESRDLEQLELLNGIIKESLRLRNTAPGLDPRVSPAHGTSKFGRIDELPSHTRVGTYGRHLNRNPDVYLDPEVWNPYRWVSKEPKDLAAMNRWFYAFGSGQRGCIGQPIAMELLRMGIASIYTSFKTSVADETEYPGAECMSAACTETLLLRFEEVPSEP
ncbi:Tryprostatin B 6-hydroxylase [Colletotrichum siamense]|nr:Tryprostatin B 6-hydroxylase [Colletotrichum siamense]